MIGSKCWGFVVLFAVCVEGVTQEKLNGSSLTPTSVMKTAVDGLLGRLLHERSREFIVEIRRGTESDYFKVIGEGVAGQPVRVWAGSGVSAAQGVMTFLKYMCHASVSWEADLLGRLPAVWPKGIIEKQILHRYRHYNNPCVFSYSYAFWTWHRWEREIDLMALMGVNMALVLEGQETLWRQVYMELGLTDEELEDHFSGYAFLAWGRMGNIERWGGPLSHQWMQERLEIQKKIVKRMREFGMLTVLPAFSGHVPKGLLRLFPDANVTKLPAWGHFSEPYTRTYFLDPKDPLFVKIGEEFVRKVILEMGTDHLYLSDPFNEMTPASSNLTYLADVSRSIYRSLTKGDPQAIWVTQGWMFFSDEDFWQKPQAKAYLTSVPQGKMLVLDLAAEVYPQYGRLESFYGQPFVFCLLNNYGGVRGLFGNVGILMKNLQEAQQYPNSSMVGTGMTPEGIGSNYVIFDLMSEMSWRSNIENVAEWAVQYARRRYGARNKKLEEAWKLLLASIYNCSQPIRFHGRFIPLMRRPTLRPKTKIWYFLKDLVMAWDLLIHTAKGHQRHRNICEIKRHGLNVTAARDRNEILLPLSGFKPSGNESRVQKKKNQKCRGQTKGKKRTYDSDGNVLKEELDLFDEETYKYDLVEVTRELMQIAAATLIKRLITSYRNGDVPAVEIHSNQLQDLIKDMDILLGSNSVYLLGSWLQSASVWANDTKEHSLLRRNALYQISLWGPNGEILDYAVKQWNGVMMKYIAPRWGAFSSSLLSAMKAGIAFDEAKFKNYVFETVEKPFAENVNTFFPPTPQGDPVKLAVRMYKKYRPLFTRRKLMKQYMKLVMKAEE
ncbi:alpha-N-acetylglucosaminidase-like isoform X2 [Eriocheir sinensis]|uniref:alpha-N-acetylglucosaminidase-like isoform X1 n=1 Tax=Eriocheir sinensis TaxID=95602 RepID=UPI0021C7F763|nr:alpha-N-acetylglucosaminidase-like isoform X1 [Eriocheir sinensis]XP_050700044.1 alpha-N-acetylglucosaminidase-like isoform X2 [Eriocheir sinensis]